ncbi:hypothetical protein IEQ34_021728 [Dendrobium chrysotoxum]|uniref:Uncharacterized protein n=1 Tax=Dendrobium chrysotoxum TaxID=161865 RepID=A0AAV7G3T6_DENCH|nr:hypothetical protein IEQ34_021728 [Dendrobium chrysotoxum]
MEAKLKRRGLFSRKLSTYLSPPPKTTMQQTSKVKTAPPPPPPPRSLFANGDRLTISMPTKNIQGSGGESADWKAGQGERGNGAMIPYSEVDEMATSYISHMKESFRLEKMYVN